MNKSDNQKSLLLGVPGLILNMAGSAEGYINFECNALGNLHSSYIKDPTLIENGFADYRMLTEAEGEQIKILSSVHDVIDPIDLEPHTWTLALEVPWALFKQVTGMAEIEGGMAC